MARVIWKYPVEFGGWSREMPAGAVVRCVAMQGGVPRLWVEVDATAPLTARRFLAVGTGQPLPERALAYLGTFLVDDGALVQHVYEVVDAAV
jgi:hypothetical protein